jgi:hypothetical protein
MRTTEYETGGGIRVRRTVEDVPLADAIEPLIDALDARRGVLLASNYEYPGRYTRWDMGFVDPPLVLVARGRSFRLDALNARGRVLLPALAETLRPLGAVAGIARESDAVTGVVREPAGRFAEEDRSRQPSIFSVLRAIVALFQHREDPHLGLYGAFGYDLAFQFEPIRLRLPRPPEQRDLVLYLPDELLIVDHRRELAMRRRYDFAVAGDSTADAPRTGAIEPYVAAAGPVAPGDHAPGEYAATVRLARESFRRSAVGTSSRSSPARPLSGRRRRHRRRCSGGCGRVTPRPTASSSTWVRASTWWAPRRRCTCASMGIAWRPAPSRGPSREVATRWPTPLRSAPCSARPRTRRS